MIYEAYRRQRPKADFAELLEQLIANTRDVIASLSTALRRLDQSPLRAGVNETLLQQGTMRKGTAAKLNFLIVGSARTLDWYAAMPNQDDPAEVRALWEELAQMEAHHLRLMKAFLGEVEL